MAALPRNAMSLRRLLQIAVEDEAYQRAALCITAQICRRCQRSVMCGPRLIDKSFFTLMAALVGCGHVTGLLMRRGRPLAIMR
jgi:hypothetical protein